MRGLSHISNWKKEIGKVSTVFHSADWDGGISPSLWDSSSSSSSSSGGGGGGGGSGAYIYQVRRGLCRLSVKRRPAGALKCSDGVRARRRVITAYHTPLLLHTTTSEPSAGGSVYKALWTNNALIIVLVWKISVSALRAATMQTLTEDNGY